MIVSGSVKTKIHRSRVKNNSERPPERKYDVKESSCNCNQGIHGIIFQFYYHQQTRLQNEN